MFLALPIVRLVVFGFGGLIRGALSSEKKRMHCSLAEMKVFKNDLLTRRDPNYSEDDQLPNTIVWIQVLRCINTPLP